MSPAVDEEGSEHHEGEVLARLSIDHRRLVESVTALQGLLGRLHEQSAARAFLSHLQFTHEFCELVHFPLEDAVLEVVLEAGLTPTERRVVFVNLAQHQQIYADAVAVLEREPDRSPEGSMSGGDFSARAEAYVNALRSHLEFESRHLQPLMGRDLPERDRLRLQSRVRDLLAALAGKPLERLAALDAASRAIAGP